MQLLDNLARKVRPGAHHGSNRTNVAPSAAARSAPSAPHVSGLWVYPVKSCKGINVQKAVMTPSGRLLHG